MKPAYLFVFVVCYCVVQCLAAGDQEHLARTANPSEMIVSWFTTTTTDSATVRYYSNPNNILTAVGSSATYNAPSGYVHHTLLTGLSANTMYYYQCRGTSNNWTDWYNFITSNVTFEIPYQIPVYGDMGITHSANTMARITKLIQQNTQRALAEPIPFILHVGDISYADDRPSTEYEKVWNEWFDLMSNVTRYVPYMVNPGNHEHESGAPHLSYSEYFIEYNYRFKMPLATNILPDKSTRDVPSPKYYGDPNNMRWSIDHQNIHLIAFSTETDFPGAEFNDNFGDQLTWLKNDLIKANSNRANVPWIIVQAHRPIYSSSNSNYIRKYMGPIQTAFEDLLHEYNVDLFLCGHVHAYERTWPVYHNKTVQKNYNNPQGLVVLTVGSAGCIEGLSNAWDTPTPDWSAFHYGLGETYGILHVHSNTELQWQLFRSSDNVALDSFTITKN